MVKKSQSAEHKVLYRKYRSNSFSEVIGQSHITKVLENSIKNDSFAHAYLFSGPRGIGKTTVARILAKRINGIDERTNAQDVLDIIEIDAASNRRIDDIRDLRSKVQIAPSSLKYKVYIIDEVHMLTKESFNALLKTLEEPPAHIIFILATTEAHKLPATIISRTQHFKFKPISIQDITNHLADIARRESIEIDKPALQLIAKRVDGGMRDAVSLLDQISSMASKIDLKTAELFLGIANQESVAELINSVIHRNTKDTLSLYKDFIGEGVDPLRLAGQLYDLSKNKLLEENDKLKQQSYINLMRAALDAIDSQSPKLTLEINLISCALSDYSTSTESDEQPIRPTSERPTQTRTLASSAPVKILTTTAPKLTSTTKKSPAYNAGQSEQISHKTKIPKKPPTGSTKISNHNTTISDQKVANNENQLWEAIVKEIRSANSSLAGLLSQVVAKFNDTTITIICPYKFHVKRLETAKYQSLLMSVCTVTYREDVQLSIIQDNSQFKAKSTALENNSPQQEYPSELSELQKIMGGQIINV